MLTAAFALAVLGALCLAVAVAGMGRDEAPPAMTGVVQRVRIEQVFTERADYPAWARRSTDPVETLPVPMQTRPDRVQQAYRPYDEAARRTVLLDL